MLSTGLVLIIVVAIAAALVSLWGVRLDGWAGIAIGAVEVGYCYLATSSLSLIPVLFVSGVLVLCGIVGISVRWLSRFV